MDIASIQKRKFLNNIYKLAYSEGKKPIESEIRKMFNKYFTYNQLGKPINIEYYSLENFNQTNVDVINELMANSLFNIEILYDAIIENNQELFSVVTSLNNKLDGLKTKRKELESKIDSILFANSNTDGFFYSFLENFNTTNNIDLALTSAYVDLTNNHVSLPKVSNITSDQIVVNNFSSSNVTFSTSLNSQSLLENSLAEGFDSVFDGLNDTYWSYDLESNSLGVAAITFTIPVNSGYSISAIEGNLLTSSPSSVYLRAVPSLLGKEEQIRVKDSLSDYNRFSFSIPADFYSTIYLTIVKAEPDSVITSVSNVYRYSFGIRELSIYSSYYDQNATVISKPISIPTNDNSNLLISAISIDTKSQVPDGTTLTYYVAPNVDGATDSASFNWKKIDPSPEFGGQNLVEITPTNLKSKFIDSSGSELLFIPLNSDSSNINELNPAKLPFSDKDVYRVCSVNSQEKFITPYILSDIDCYYHYNIILNTTVNGMELYKSLETWSNYINQRSIANVNFDILKNQTTSLNPGLFMSSVGLFEAKMLCDSSISVSHMISKSSADFNLAVYLNNTLIADLPVGVNQKNIEWNFQPGINTISITYDKNFTGNISFNLMNGKSITEYGTLFLNYLDYLDPIQFRSVNLNELSVFTIDNIYGNYEVLSSRMISNRSNIRYYTTVAEEVSSIRYRVDFNRFNNPLQSPFLDSLRIKFKHNDSVI